MNVKKNVEKNQARKSATATAFFLKYNMVNASVVDQLGPTTRV